MKIIQRINWYLWLFFFVSLSGYSAITVTPGGSGSGGTGGVLTNNTVAAVIANFYTNSTPHWIEGEARLGTSTAGRIQCAVTNSDNTLFFHYQNEVAIAGATSNTISFKVPPGGWWKFIGLTTTATDGSQQLLYNATNGSVVFATTAGSVTDGATQSGLASGSYAVSGNGAGLTNVPASSIVKYISQTKPVNADSNWFGPWTPGTVTAGIQEAWDSVVKPTNAGPTARGVVFQFEGGYYYFTNALVFSNYFPMAMTFRGANLLDTKLVYAGTAVGTNTITFKGAGTPRADSLNLPNHLTFTDIGFTAINDTTNTLVELNDYSHVNFTRCNFTSWRVMTNQVEGAGVSTSSSSVGGVTSGNLVGLRTMTANEHGVVLSDLFFAGLAIGMDLRNDHTTAFALRFAHIGVFASQWPATSRNSLGACILKEGGLDSVFYYCHFYSADAAFILLETEKDTPLLDHPNFEAVSIPMASLPNQRAPVVRDYADYAGTPEWPSAYCYVLSNSPNYGIVGSQIVTNFVAYGSDSSAAAAGSPYLVWKVRYGEVDRIGVDELGVKVKGRLEMSTAGNLVTLDPDNTISISDSGFAQYVSLTPSGTIEATVSASSPKLIVGTSTITSGTGAPSADEPKGSLYLRTDGSTSTTLYVKTATGGGGWTAK